MSIYARALVPLDGSPVAELKVPHVLGVLPIGGRLDLLYVSRHPLGSALPRHPLARTDLSARLAETRRNGSQYLETVRERILDTRPDLHISRHLSEGPPEARIASLGQELDVDLLVLTDDHEACLRKLLFSRGGKALDIPVLVVRDSPRDGQHLSASLRHARTSF